MNPPFAPLAAECEALSRAYAALNRGDIPAFMQLLDDRIEWSDPPGSPAAGTYRGRAAVESHITAARAGWAEGSCEPRRLIARGDNVVVLVDVRVRLKHETEWREGQLADVYTFAAGKATHLRSYVDRAEALRVVGVEASAFAESQ